MSDGDLGYNPCCGGDSKACMVNGPCAIEREKREMNKEVSIKDEPIKDEPIEDRLFTDAMLKRMQADRVQVNLEGAKAHGDPHMYYLVVRVEGHVVYSKGFINRTIKPRHYKKAMRIAKKWTTVLEAQGE